MLEIAAVVTRMVGPAVEAAGSCLQRSIAAVVAAVVAAARGRYRRHKHGACDEGWPRPGLATPFAYPCRSSQRFAAPRCLPTERLFDGIEPRDLCAIGP